MYATVSQHSSRHCYLNDEHTYDSHEDTECVAHIAFVQVALEANTVPPEGASKTELEHHRLAKIVDGLIVRKVQQPPQKVVLCAVPAPVLVRPSYRDGVLLVATLTLACVYSF